MDTINTPPDADRDELARALQAKSKNGPVPVRIMGAMSCPRICFADNMFEVMKLTGMGIPVHRAGGAFWDQGLCQLFEAAIAEGAPYDYVLTIDYDTLFEKRDVMHLIHLAVASEAAAIFPIQYRREADQILLGLAEGIKGYDDGEAPRTLFDEQLIRAKVGHFGCTLISTKALRQLPKPWMHARPAPDGSWGAGRMDADISFWDNMWKAGLPVYCASRVLVGHCQLVATYPGENFEPVHRYLTQYQTEGDIPKEVSDAASRRAGFDPETGQKIKSKSAKRPKRKSA